MGRVVRLVTEDVALTAGVLLVCFVIGYLVGEAAGRLSLPTHARLAEYEQRRLVAEVRGAYVTFSLWTGLAIAQTVFLVAYLAPPVRLATPLVNPGQAEES
jgi:hypothetical protein